MPEPTIILREWRPLLIGEYPPPGPTMYGPAREDGTLPILVYAEPLATPLARFSDLGTEAGT